VSEIVFRAPVEILEAAGEIMLPARPIEDPLRLRQNFLADSVAGDGCNS
jgi:hypothetical protein